MRIIRFLAVFACVSSYFVYVFRLTTDEPWTAGLGDWIDPYFINGLLEHWYQTLMGLTSPQSPPMFHPARGTLGYSHGLVLYVPFYAAVRPFLDPFQSHNFALFLVMVTGSLCLYAFFRRVGLSFLEAVLVSALFWTSANVINGGVVAWSQRASVFLVPPMLLMGHIAFTSSRTWVRLVSAFGVGLGSMLLLVQDFYTGVFVWLTAGVCAICAEAIVLWIHRPPTRTWPYAGPVVRGLLDPPLANRPVHSLWFWLAALSLAWAAIVFVHPIERTMIGPIRFSSRDPVPIALIGSVVALWYAARRWRWSERVARTMGVMRGARATRAIPAWRRQIVTSVVLGLGSGAVLFLAVYLGSFLERGQFPDDQFWSSLAQPDLSAVSGPHSFVSALQRYDTFRPFIISLVFAALVFMPFVNRRPALQLSGLCALVWSAFVFVTPLRFGDFSIWKAAVGWMPGLSAIRDPGRIIFVYDLLIASLAAIVISRLPAKTLARAMSVGVIGITIALTWNSYVLEFNRPNSTFERWVEAPIAVDSSCRSFFIDGASETYMSRSGHMWSLYGVDALFVALRYGIPTLNGYSAWGPIDWELANPQDRQTYDERVRRWIGASGLEHVCRFDIERRTMTRYR